MRRVDAPPPKWVIALTGPPAAGKGEVVRFLAAWAEGEGLRFGHLGFSDEVRAEVRARGGAEAEITRETLTRVATEMRRDEGPGVLAKRIVERIQRTPRVERPDVYVLEALRHTGEIDVLREVFGPRLVVVAVTADLDLLADRLLARARPDESSEAMQGHAEAVAVMRRELGGTGGKSGFRIADCVERADVLLTNDGTLADLEAEVGRFVRSLGTPQRG